MSVIRTERPEDAAAIRSMVSTAMRPNEARLIDRIRRSEHYVPDLALVAEEDGEIVGMALLSYVGLEGEELLRVLALAPVAVRPDRQRRGIGSALIREGLARSERRGEPLVVVLGDSGYYPRFGFQPARSHGIAPPGPEIPEDDFMVKTLAGYRPRYRGRVVYPPAFDET